MTKRPPLTRTLSAEQFRDFYYLKEELVDFCRLHGLQRIGGKLELGERITIYLETGKKSTTLRT